ncbi:ABC transporter permease [Marininema halotolerans]|uniref:ABC-2 type transport system permease protein n=1 Tax=Marininema halotolerans TaxID=1155944 RepID=A0A1I6U378_9BACL|nr:ABC transporter permease [Marininema halotolerans]SFS95828.1 ABC-2 type transport system permease protein [Marininema halotolerans]
MKDLEQLFSHRRKHAWQKGLRYATLIAKTLQVFPLFALLLLYFGYKAFLQWMPADFPASLLMAILLTGVLTQTKHRTFAQPADPYFLLPAGAVVQKYFREAFRYNLIMEIGKTLLWMLFFSPLYLVKIGEASEFTLAIVLILLLKGWNLILFRLAIISGTPTFSGWLRGGSNLLILMWLFDGRYLIVLIPLALIWMGLLFFHYQRHTPPAHLIPWEEWISRERQTVSTYYRFASQFIEVPQVGNEIRIRKWVSFVEKFVPKQTKNTYLYLYLRTFLRYSEPFGASLRLTLVGAVILLVFQPSWLPAWIVLLVMLLGTGIQLPWIRHHHNFQPWFRLYPRPEQQKRTDLGKLMGTLLISQSFLVLLIQPQLWYFPLTWGLPLLLLSSGVAWLIGCVWLPKKH